MSPFVQSFLRCVLALVLWVGASAAASSAEPAAAEAFGPRSDLHLRLIELLGGPELCGDEDGDEVDVLCGGDLLADLLVDPSVLKLSRGSCSRLLEELFKRAVCDPRDESCGKINPGRIPPAVPPDLVGPTGVAALGGVIAALGPQRAVLRALRARDDPPLPSHTTCPNAPPPRARPA